MVVYDVVYDMAQSKGQHLKILGTPGVTQTLRAASFCDIFEIYAEFTNAVAAFPHEFLIESSHDPR